MSKASQQHGFEFEKQVKDDFSVYLSLMNIDYVDKWDIPPTSVKSFQFTGNRIEFGSIENIFSINNNFFLVLIGWEQFNDIKKVVFSDVLLITQKQLTKMKGMLSITELKKLSDILRSYKKGEHEEAREWYKSIKESYEDKTLFNINFKVDSGTQRRIQCSLDLRKLYKILGTELVEENKLSIQSISSKQRKRNKDKHESS